MNLFRPIAQWFRKWIDRFGPARRLIIVEGDSLPAKMPFRDLVLAQDDGEDWSVGMKCPCGCGRTIELLVIQEAKPRWDITVDADGLPSLNPSVWLTSGCKSHFWLRRGKVVWV
ncbi:hypothetical protein EFK07_30585 [Pseudomonas putida]|uniref:Uncharacterized protein n=1 Tax=Pseudomonas putida TaxID=303 RepID=A0A3M8SFA1_PSEPU|nr:DUF6527 family protein [Pseudomonas putida]RNF77480.1 hypothetical protein EFK07_30585 [Pseudomonas putida]